MSSRQQTSSLQACQERKLATLNAITYLIFSFILFISLVLDESLLFNNLFN